LLAVAREVFLERGIRATTLEVAERAGVSEGVLFHRFKSKEGLFSAAMDFDGEHAPDAVLNAIASIEGLDVREGLVELATKLLEVGRVALPILMMSWSNPQPCSVPIFDKKRHKFRDVLKALGGYFERQMEAGKLRRMDAEVLARTLLGAVHHFAMTRLSLEEGDGAVMPEGMFVRGLADLLLNGASETNAVPPRHPRFATR
jgi:AcrR family transcriptional regulator